jgi:mannose-6-phosphate isomerase-like protein (cupin superfamily)
MTAATVSYSAPTESSATVPQPTHRPAIVVPPSEGTRVLALGNEIFFKLGTEQTEGTFALGLATVPAGSGPPPHVHEVQDELFLILEGQYRVFSDGTSVDVGPGTVVYLPRGTEHAFGVIGTTPGRHWALTMPGGFERYYAGYAEVFAEPGSPDLARLAKLNAEHHVRVTFPAEGRPAE